MQLEIQSLDDNHTWEVVVLLAGKVPIDCKQIYKIKYNADGSVETRLLSNEYTQHEGLDFHDTFSHVAKLTTVRAIAATTTLKICAFFKSMCTMYS